MTTQCATLSRVHRLYQRPIPNPTNSEKTYQIMVSGIPGTSIPEDSYLVEWYPGNELKDRLGVPGNKPHWRHCTGPGDLRHYNPSYRHVSEDTRRNFIGTWSDKNGDEQISPDEVTTFEDRVGKITEHGGNSFLTTDIDYVGTERGPESMVEYQVLLR